MKTIIKETDCASLSNKDEYTVFSFNGINITFLSSKRLEKYIEVKEWDDGYIVVMAKNVGENPHEDYIDLRPILENLYMNADEFLKDVKKVEVSYEYGRNQKNC